MDNPDTQNEDQDSLLGKLIRSFTGQATDPQNPPDSSGQQNPIVFFLNLLVQFFKSLLGPDNEAAQNGIAGTGPQNEEGRTQDFKKSTIDYFLSGDVRNVPQKLVDLRKRLDPNWQPDHPNDKRIEAILPVKGDVVITDAFGHRDAPMEGASTEHKGLDIAPKVKGTNLEVVAPMPGVVIGTGWRNGYGNTVEIMDIYGVRHRFGHLKSISVQKGETVEQGQDIAVMGQTGRATGVHLHYEQRIPDGSKDGLAVNPTILDKHLTNHEQVSLAQNEQFLDAQRLFAAGKSGTGSYQSNPDHTTDRSTTLGM